MQTTLELIIVLAISFGMSVLVCVIWTYCYADVLFNKALNKARNKHREQDCKNCHSLVEESINKVTYLQRQSDGLDGTHG